MNQLKTQLLKKIGKTLIGFRFFPLGVYVDKADICCT